eukprot:360121-Chlamydomonas_euryale.AAC.23
MPSEHLDHAIPAPCPCHQSTLPMPFRSHPANRMWHILIKTGLAPPGATGPCDDDRAPSESGVGFTDLGTGHPGTDSSQFSSEVCVAAARGVCPLDKPLLRLQPWHTRPRCQLQWPFGI